MALFPRWFLLEETSEQRKLRHAQLRKQLADNEYRLRLEAEEHQLQEEIRESEKKPKGRHRKS
jgi:hypothetical protein